MVPLPRNCEVTVNAKSLSPYPDPPPVGMSAQDILDAVAARLDAAADRLEGCPATLRAVAAELRALVQELG